MDSRLDLGLVGLEDIEDTDTVEGIAAGKTPLLGRRRCSCSGAGKNWLSRLLGPTDDSMRGMRPVILTVEGLAEPIGPGFGEASALLSVQAFPGEIRRVCRRAWGGRDVGGEASVEGRRAATRAGRVTAACWF